MVLPVIWQLHWYDLHIYKHTHSTVTNLKIHELFILNIFNHLQLSMSDMSSITNPQEEDDFLNHTNIIAKSQKIPSPNTFSSQILQKLCTAV